VVVGHTGNHRMRGVFAAAGPKIEPGPIESAHIYDVLPTMFHLAGWPAPCDLDGRALTEICRPDCRDVRLGPPSPAATREPGEYADASREIILRRLRDLGYFG
jgi:arylsulfatase A-like enzyme